MTEEPEVTRLLRAARAEEPMPDDVVARLDATLADLVADRSADGEASNVVPLRPRRRRTALLAAAAAVIAVGVGGSLLGQGGDDNMGDRAVSTPDSATGAAESESGEGFSDLGEEAPALGADRIEKNKDWLADENLGGSLSELQSTMRLVEPPLTDKELRTVERAVADQLGEAYDAQSNASAYVGRLQRSVSSCAVAASDRDVVSYVVRQRSTTPRVIDVLTCEKGRERLLTSVTLPPRE